MCNKYTLNYRFMKKQSFVNKLVFDHMLVTNLKQSVSEKQLFYHYLISGKISLKEYLALMH